MKALFANKIFIGVLVVLVGGGIVWGIASNGHTGEIIKVQKGEVVQKVVVTGKVKAQKEVSLAFDKTGRVTQSWVAVGDKVAAGEIIAQIDTSNVIASISQERARLSEERGKLGGEGEELLSAIKEAYTASDNAVRNKADQFFRQPTENPVFEVKFADGNLTHYFNIDGNLAIELSNSRKFMEVLLIDWQRELSPINATNLGSFANAAISRMNAVSDFLNKVALVVNSFTPDNFAYEATVAGYKTAIDSARTAVESKRAALITAKESFWREAVSVEISPGQARIAQIEASIKSLEADIFKSKIIAPFSGTITMQEAKVGSVALAGTNVVSLISESDMHVEANISEINIGKVNIGNPAQIKFDAFPGEIFTGRVSYVEPGETIIDGVVNYKTRIEFDHLDERIKSGLSAEVEITVGRTEQVLTLPSYAIEKEKSGSYVTTLTSGDREQKVLVEVGLVGSDGTVEILSGLNEGDQVVYKLK